MTTPSQKLSANLKKSMVCIVALSALTGGLVILEDYRITREAQQFSEHLKQFSHPVTIKSQQGHEQVFFKKHQDDSLLTTDANELAKIAEQNLVAKQTSMMSKPLDVHPEKIALNKSISQQDLNEKQAQKIDPNGMNVLFSLSSSQITPEYKLQLLDVADYINSHGDQTKWQVVGHTDKSGRASYNLDLAKERANNVARFLVEHGVQQTQLTLFTLGEYEAGHTENSTYNASLRKVQVMPYESSIEKLAKMIKRDNQQAEQYRLVKAQLNNQKNVIEKEFRHITETLKEDNNTVQLNTELNLGDINLQEQEVSMKQSLSNHRSNNNKELLVDDDSNLLNTQNSISTSQVSTLSLNEPESLAYASGYSL
ncbi:OmpA family protein [Psychromonas sp.]|uniref:OmpA family protein n=1 Tax=Psychromonas sp. TaxID=1884585 RepID=UPI003A985344